MPPVCVSGRCEEIISMSSGGRVFRRGILVPCARVLGTIAGCVIVAVLQVSIVVSRTVVVSVVQLV